MYICRKFWQVLKWGWCRWWCLTINIWVNNKQTYIFMFVYMYIIFIFAKFSKPLKTRLFKWLLTSAYKQKYIHTNKHKYVCIYVHIFLVPFFTHSLTSFSLRFLFSFISRQSFTFKTHVLSINISLCYTNNWLNVVTVLLFVFICVCMSVCLFREDTTICL